MKRIIDFPIHEPEPDQPPKIIPSGWYPAEIIDVDERESHYGNLYYAWSLHIESVHPRFRMNVITSTAPTAIWKLQDLVQAVTGIRPQGKISFWPEMLVSKKVMVEVTVEKYNGEERNGVRGFARA